MQLTRREFLLQTSACVGYALALPRSSAGVQRFCADQCLRTGRGLSRARLRVPGRRQRRQQHGRADRHDRVQPVLDRAHRVGTGHCPRQPAADHAADRSAATFGLHPSLADLHTLWGESGSCRWSATSGRSCSRSRARTIRPARRARISCSRTPIRWRSGRRRSPIASGRRAGAGARRIASRRTPSGFPTDHRALGRHLHSRTDHHAAVDRGGTDGAQSGAGAERIRHGRRRSRPSEIDGLPAHDRHDACAGRRRQPDDAAGGQHRADPQLATSR